MHGTGRPLGKYTRRRPNGARKDAEAIAETLKAADRVLVLGHAHADGDVAGSSLGLAQALRELGKDVVVYNEAPYPDAYAWLPGGDEVVSVLSDEDAWDATVVVDAADPARCGAQFPGPDRRGTFIWIDHHRIDQPPGDLNYIDLTAAAVGEQIAGVLDAMGVEPSRAVAQCLYASLMADTGGFKYGNTSARAFKLASRLVACGVDPWEMTERIYERQDEARTRLLGKVLCCFERSPCGRFGVATLTDKDMEDVGAGPEHIQGLVNHVRAVRGIEIAGLVHEVEGGVKLILRSRGNLTCRHVAARLGGRGSRNAATFTLRGVTVKDAAARLMETLAEEAAPHEASGEGAPVTVRIGGQPLARKRRAVGG